MLQQRVCIGLHSSTLRLPCLQKKDAHAISDAQLEKEREQLAKALERLADVQHELADGQRNLMNGELMPVPDGKHDPTGGLHNPSKVSCCLLPVLDGSGWQQRTNP